MAIRYRKEYGTWQVYWHNPITGKRESKSFTDQKDAEKENSLVIHRLKYEPESFKVPVCELAQTATTRTLEQVYLEYLCEKKFSKADLVKHRSNFSYILATLGQKDIALITQTDIEHVKNYMACNYTPATANGRLRIFRTIMYYAAEKGYIEKFNFPKIPAPNYTKLVPPTQEEILAIYAADPPHIKRVIILGIYFGVRIGNCELFQLTWDDVDLNTKVVRIHGSKKKQKLSLAGSTD